MEITKELLYADGWTRTIDPVYPAHKILPNSNPLNNSEDTNIRLVIHGVYNSEQFAVLFSDGGLLNFTAKTMEDLRKFESMIEFYDTPY